MILLLTHLRIHVLSVLEESIRNLRKPRSLHLRWAESLLRASYCVLLNRMVRLWTHSIKPTHLKIPPVSTVDSAQISVQSSNCIALIMPLIPFMTKLWKGVPFTMRLMVLHIDLVEGREHLDRELFVILV